MPLTYEEGRKSINEALIKQDQIRGVKDGVISFISQNIRTVLLAGFLSGIPIEAKAQESYGEIPCSVPMRESDIGTLDIAGLQQRIHETFADKNGEMTGISKSISDRLISQLTNDKDTSTIKMLMQKIQKHTGLMPSNDEVIILINLLIHIKEGDYVTSKYLIEGIIINAKNPSCMQKAFDELSLLSYKI